MDILNGLNDAQQTAVTAPLGPVLVLAGPGSGKTRVLTHRIVYLIQEMGVPPWHILAVTFTNKAAKEMNHRIGELLNGRSRGLTMGTFHSTCARILRRETDNLPYYDNNFVIFDSDDQLKLVKAALKELNIDDKKYSPYKMLNGISNAKNELITPEAYQTGNYIAELTRRVYDYYQKALRLNNGMDFDDLLMNTVLLLQERPDVLAAYQERYQHILVDEFQDTNMAQYALLNLLAKGHGNIFVVGDSDQSIYRWRGADYRNINRFREQYPAAQMVLLEQNYRSTQLILDAAKAVISPNPNRVHKELFTERRGGDPIVIREAYDEREEATVITMTMESLLGQYSLNDMAIMYRTNAQSRALEEALMMTSMPYRLVGATKFYKRREVKDIIAYLRVVHNPADGVSFDRIINTPKRALGAKAQATLRGWARQNGWQPAIALMHLATDPERDHPFKGRAFNAFMQVGQMLLNWLALRDGEANISDIFDAILDQTRYKQYLRDSEKQPDEAEERWGNVQELRNVASQADGATLTEFLENVALVSETDNLDESQTAVTLLTLHASKGLEYAVVFIPGLEDGVLPHSRSMDDAEEMAEERRLLYVGITRAKDQLYLSHAFRRMTWGRADVSTPSRFLNDLPLELTSAGGGAKKRRQQTKKKATSWEWSSPSQPKRPKKRSAVSHRSNAVPPTRSKPLPAPNHVEDEDRVVKTAVLTYKTGQTVRHRTFGEGTVIESESTGSDEVVTVAFKDKTVGLKRMAASFAKLEII